MLYRNLFNAREERKVLFDICIPCWELSPKLKDTIDNLTSSPARVTLPAKLIVNVEKQSVVRNRLACLAESAAPFVLWLDDDIAFEQQGWDTYLWQRINQDAQLGIIGVRIKHWQLKEQTPVRPDGAAADVCGAVMMTRKLPGVGFDNNYIGSQWEDTDYCFEVRKAGYHVLQDNRVTVLHYNEEKNRDYTHNQAYFCRKWGIKTCASDQGRGTKDQTLKP